jgi:outer membrane protein OmpA-like peptidoglycan-associated protein
LSVIIPYGYLKYQLWSITQSRGSAGKKFLIVRHTDKQGELSQHQTLSQKRAAAVTSSLVSKYGVPSGNVIPVGRHGGTSGPEYL